MASLFSTPDTAFRFDLRQLLLRQLLMCLLVAAGLLDGVRAEILPRWRPTRLVPRADIVLLGHEVSLTTLRVEKVFKGTWTAKGLEIPQLSRFRKEYGFLTAFGENRAPDLSKRVVVFVSLRRGSPTIVANGVYRLTKQGAVLGYAQDENPGPYELQAKPVYESLQPLIEETDAAVAELPQQHAALIKEVTDARQNSVFSQKLNQLENITCVGDTPVFEFVARELDRGHHTGHYLSFLQSIPDPSILPVLWAYYEKTGDVKALTAIGRQGNSAAAVLLDRVIRREPQEEPRRFACYALMCLYEACERAGKEDQCEALREMVFRLYDEEPFVANYTKGSPRLLGVTAHRGAVVRLERNLAAVKDDSSNRKYSIESVLKECRQRIRERELADQERRHNE